MTDQVTEVRAALEAARQKPTVTLANDRWQSSPLPAPIGVNCPDHPTYPLVIREGAAWCRRGQHVVA